MTKVAIVFFGMARRPSLTVEHIRRNIIEPNAALGVEFVRIASLNLLDKVSNPRSKEVGVEVPRQEVFLLEADTYLLCRQDAAAIAAPLQAARAQRDAQRDGFASARNLLHQLASLKRAWPLVQPLEPGIDAVLFLRPDLLYHDALVIPDVLRHFDTPNCIAVPAWGSYGGLNDRFALAGFEAARHYANRLDLVERYCTQRSLHAESLLAFALKQGGCRVAGLPVTATRIRLDGRHNQEEFDVRLPLSETPVTLPVKPINPPATLSPAPLPPRPAQPAPRFAQGRRIAREMVGAYPRSTALSGLSYLDLLNELHSGRQVRSYFEIGTQYGASLRHAKAAAVAVDPAFMLDKTAWSTRAGVRLFEMTSDAFFAAHDPKPLLGGPIELAFIDGMHLADYVLRDFVNVERHCAPDGVIVLHDAIPQNFEMAERDRRPAARRDRKLAGAWTGDVWRVLPILARERPDLHIQVLDCPPTGLVLISGLDPASTHLAERLPALEQELTGTEQEEQAFWAFLEALEVHDSRAPLPDPGLASPAAPAMV